MPSPVGHALAGVAAGWLVCGARVPSDHGRHAVRNIVLFGSLGVLPDVDLLFGMHSGPTHGIGAAVAVGFVVWAVARGLGWKRTARLAVACTLAYGSHIPLDWLGADTSPPIGIMALWPFSREYYQSGLHVFRAVSRRYGQPELFWVPNFLALLRELLILVPLLVAIRIGHLWKRGQVP